MMIAGLLVTGAGHGGHRLHRTSCPGSWRPPPSPASAPGLLGPAQQAAIADVIGNERSGGRVLAVFQMTSDIGAIIGPVLAGLLADRLGYGWAFGVTGGVLVVGCRRLAVGPGDGRQRHPAGACA